MLGCYHFLSAVFVVRGRGCGHHVVMGDDVVGCGCDVKLYFIISLPLNFGCWRFEHKGEFFYAVRRSYAG